MLFYNRNAQQQQPSSTNNTNNQNQSTAAGPVMTSVAPRERPVTTSLAPRQRPKGNNNQMLEAQEENTAVAFKHSSSSVTQQRGSDEHNQEAQFQAYQQQQQHFMQQQQQQQQQMNFYQQQVQQQQILQQEMLMRQQQQAYQQQQQQQQQQQALQQALQQQQELEMAAKQKEEYMRHRQEQYTRLQKLKEEEEQAKIRMQRIMVQKQRVLDDDFNPRDDRMCHSVEPPSSLVNNNSKRHQQVSDQPASVSAAGLFDDDFSQSTPDLTNPFNNNSDSNMVPSFDLTGRHASDDNLHNPPPSSSMTSSSSHSKKTHARSRSDTFTRLAANRVVDRLGFEHSITSHRSHNNQLSTGQKNYNNTKQPSPRLSPIPFEKENSHVNNNTSRPLVIDTSEQRHDIATEGPNPFRGPFDHHHVSGSKAETAVLLALDDEDGDDSHFNQLQYELKHLGVVINNNSKEATENQRTNQSNGVVFSPLDVSRNDASPLLSPNGTVTSSEKLSSAKSTKTSADGVNKRQYVYRRTSSCSSSNNSNSSDESNSSDSEDTGDATGARSSSFGGSGGAAPTHAYQDCNSSVAHQESGSEIVNVVAFREPEDDEEQRRLDRTAQVVGKAWSVTKNSHNVSARVEKDIFDAAPFQPPSVAARQQNANDNDFDRPLSSGGSPGHKPKRRMAKKEKHHRSRQSITDDIEVTLNHKDPSRTQSMKATQATKPLPENPFDEFIASRNVVTKTVSHPPTSSSLGMRATTAPLKSDDPFCMVPMKAKSSSRQPHNKKQSSAASSSRPDKSSSNAPGSSSSHGDPFNMAPMAVKNKALKKRSTTATNSGDDPFGSAPFTPNVRPSHNAPSGGDKARKKRILPEIP